MEEIEQVFKKIKIDKDLTLFKLVHKTVCSLGKNIQFAIFPIYVRYTIKDKVVAILYFNKKNFLDLGLNIHKNLTTKQFVNADYMKYPGITYSIKINSKTDIKNIKIDK